MFHPSFALAAFMTIAGSSPFDNTAPATDKGPDKPAKVKAAAVGEAGEISGYYTCKGQEAGGKKYSGVAAISKKGEIYLVTWMVGAGSSFSGIGIRQGNMLAVSWTLPSERGTIRGVNLYRIEAGPRLSGRWATLPGPGIMQSETLTYLKAIDDEE